MRQDFSLFSPSTPATSVAMKNSRKGSGACPLEPYSLKLSATTIKNAPNPTNTVYATLTGIYFKAFINDTKLTQTNAAVKRESYGVLGVF